MSIQSYLPRPLHGASLTGRFWGLATAVSLLVAGLVPLLWNPRYFFRGDTQAAYTPWWYLLGDKVLHGELPLLDPLWMVAGNYAAEGQLGMFSPLTILIGIGARIAPNLAVYATFVKLCFLMAGGVGTYLLIRSFRVQPPVAYIGGLLVGLSGVSVYLDWPSWVNGQMATALLPWAWWATRRAMRGANPITAIVMCYLVVSIGYIYAALYLAVVLFGCLVEAAVSRDHRAFLRALVIGVLSGLIVVTVYLPGFLTAPVTRRAAWSEVTDAGGGFSVDVTNVLVSMLPATTRYYLMWCLPMLFWIDWHRARGMLKDLAGVLVSTAILLVWVLGPAAIGPIRWPMRVVPALMVALTVLLVVFVAHTIRLPLSRSKLAISLAWVVFAGYLTVSRSWEARGLLLISVVYVVVGLSLVAWLLRHGAAAVALLMGVWTIAGLVIQLSYDHTPGAVDRQTPGRVTEYRTQLPAARGDVMLVGNWNAYWRAHPADTASIGQALLSGSSWYLNPQAVQAGETAIDFLPYRERFCRYYDATTCKKALPAVVAKEDTTGLRWLDLLSVSTLVMFRPDFKESVMEKPPAGWHVADRTEWTVVWVRDEVVPTAGGVVWESDGVKVSETGSDTQTVRFTVNEVPADGGTVVLSRLAWPGYRVSGASLDDPLADTLVRVRIDPGSAGQTVTVRWDPPGWNLERMTWWIAVITALAWAVAEALLHRRRRQKTAGRTTASNDSGVEQQSDTTATADR